MPMELHTTKIKTIIAVILVLSLVVPFIFSSAYAMASHTHICHDKTHEDDCTGRNDCCKICQYIISVKNRPLYYSVVGRLSTTFAPALSLSVVCIGPQHLSFTSLISLKVRLNN